MKLFPNVQAAKRLGISSMSLGRYIRTGKIPTPKMLQAGSTTLYAWTLAEIEHVRQLLPKIANGRKTRYKKHSAVSIQQSAKAQRKKQKKK